MKSYSIEMYTCKTVQESMEGIITMVRIPVAVGRRKWPSIGRGPEGIQGLAVS